MRIHTVFALYVFVFSLFFDFSVLSYVLLVLTVGFVLIAEIVNTAIEELADSVTEKFNLHVRVAKDVSAAAVLVSAICAVIVGVCLFWKPPVLVKIWQYFCIHPWLFAVLAAVTVLSIFYIVLGPREMGKVFQNRETGESTCGAKDSKPGENR